MPSWQDEVQNILMLRARDVIVREPGLLMFEHHRRPAPLLSCGYNVYHQSYQRLQSDPNGAVINLLGLRSIISIRLYTIQVG